MNLGSVLFILAVFAGFALFVFVVLLALIVEHGKPSKEESFTDLLKNFHLLNGEWRLV